MRVVCQSTATVASMEKHITVIGGGFAGLAVKGVQDRVLAHCILELQSLLTHAPSQMQLAQQGIAENLPQPSA